MRRSSGAFRGHVLAAALLGTLATAPAVQAQPPAQAAAQETFSRHAPPPAPDGMSIGPLPGWTTAWHPMPGRLAIPLNGQVKLKQRVSPLERVLWDGAEELSRLQDASVAVFSADSPGLHTVRARISSALGQPRDNVAFIEVLAQDPADLHLAMARPSVTAVDLGEDASNLETMAAYFGDSVADLREIDDGHYLTSVGNHIDLQIAVHPTALAALTEWRVNGRAFGLGSSAALALHTTGTHVIEAGPPLAARAVLIDTYAARITSHVSDQDIVPEDLAVTFTASTEPPGHEDDLLWLSSTKYGQAHPVMGRGPTFTVQFSDTWGPIPGLPYGQFQWLGVRCDNDRFNQDQKTGACCDGSPCSDGLTGPACQDAGGTYQGDGSACANVTCETSGGACCISTLCFEGYSEIDCLAEGGVYQGDGSACKMRTCVLPFGACCHDGTCTDNLSLEGCQQLGGVFQGVGSACGAVDCPLPVGACCAAGTCSDAVTADDCAAGGGAYQGNDTTCDQVFCEPLTGACCIDGLCTTGTFKECVALGGDYQGDGTVCPAVDCVIAVGACCDGPTCLDALAADDCAVGGGVYQGDDSDCADVVCEADEAVVINEIRIDQPGPDDDEYFELSGMPGAALDGLTYLVIGDGAGGSGVIEVVVGLTGTALPPDGVMLVGERSLTIGGVTPDLELSLNFENSDNFTHLLVRGFSGAAGDDLDLDDDCALDLTPWTEVLDAVALVENDESPPGGTECHYGPPQVGPDGDAVPSHAVRCPDGWRIGDADPAAGDDTPGALNACV